LPAPIPAARVRGESRRAFDILESHTDRSRRAVGRGFRARQGAMWRCRWVWLAYGTEAPVDVGDYASAWVLELFGCMDKS